jgi:hypothetical protein
MNGIASMYTLLRPCLLHFILKDITPGTLCKQVTAATHLPGGAVNNKTIVVLIVLEKEQGSPTLPKSLP